MESFVVAEEARATWANPHAILDLDSEATSLLSDAPKIEATCILLLEDSEINGSTDIEEIIQSCLKEVKLFKQHNHKHAIKMLT
jgi:hypothetical protein